MRITGLDEHFRVAVREETYIEAHGGPALTLQTVPQDDPGTSAMLRRADSVGVFQVESRAQMATLPRLKPTEFYDLFTKAGENALEAVSDYAIQTGTQRAQLGVDLVIDGQLAGVDDS